MPPAGYLVNLPGGLHGDPGVFYDYILARNGLFIRAESMLMSATIQIAGTEIRGLAPLHQRVELVKGKVPGLLGKLALDTMTANREREICLAITWDGGYHLEFPRQQGNAVGVTFTKLPNTVVEMHSHPGMGAFFSHTDDLDEQGFAIYGVAGELDRLIPDVILRVGVYGYFCPLQWENVFAL